MNFLELVEVDKDSINTKCHSCPTRLLVKIFGHPVTKYSDSCRPPTHPHWRHVMVTESIGPFNVTGHREAIKLFRDAFREVKETKPELYAALGTAGMLCCRRVRGSINTPSNHALGLAVDITINGKLDNRGDGKTFRGLLELYSVLKKYGIYWGTGFPTEDAMHFEVSKEVCMNWIDKGVM